VEAPLKSNTVKNMMTISLYDAQELLSDIRKPKTAILSREMLTPGSPSAHPAREVVGEREGEREKFVGGFPSNNGSKHVKNAYNPARSIITLCLPWELGYLSRCFRVCPVPVYSWSLPSRACLPVRSRRSLGDPMKFHLSIEMDYLQCGTQFAMTPQLRIER
jgi:hypothetical protein